ncbi:helix-turn-helix transcriptional regulator [Catenulispora pinisilvae]|uniref:helix-turn-helix transcriptional regulator n=1 Tax=Catenulispora pinisilvae TaxID=2705253 RepID=UPI001891F5DF|nr:helix-turn-helix transcriptional regulator [Catenulispora pinisilvae]
MDEQAPTTLTGGRGSGRLPRQALIVGYVLRLARESVPGGCSQERLAELLAVSPDAVAGWETGRRPLSAVKAGQFVTIKAVLIRVGASSQLVRMLDVAIEADQLLDHARTAAAAYEPGDAHPLGAYVHRREVVELVAWPLSGRTPEGLPTLAPARRGPVVGRPELGAVEQDQVFDHLRRIAEANASSGDPLLRRQALYLQSYDRRGDAQGWMTDQFRRLPRTGSGWTPAWPVARTLAASLVRYGDPSTLIDFAQQGLADEPGQVADLNYWAYWVGETGNIERDDDFMPIRLGPWRGDKILRHLVDRLHAEAGVADLGITTLKTLLAARPRLLDEDRTLTGTLAAAVEQLADSGSMSPTTRRALDEIRYALRLHTR